MQNKQSKDDWGTICNMRTTLLQLQFLYNSICSQTEQQTRNLQLHQKDRLLQLRDLYAQNHQLTENNFKVLLIAKLESLLAMYEPVDTQIWNSLNNFMAYVRQVEEEMSMDVCKLYIGDKVLLDIAKCEAQLQTVERKIMSFSQQNADSIHEYRKNQEKVEELNGIWARYLRQVRQFLQGSFKEKYLSYLRGRLQIREKQLQKSIKILKNFITQ